MEKKFLIGVFVFTALIVLLGIFIASGSSSKASIGKTEGAKIEINETKYSFGRIAYKGGLVTHSYLIKNTGNKDLIIGNMSTSCHCTKVYFEKKDFKSPGFGMRGTEASIWTGSLKPSEAGKITAVFDPAFHGPQGVGPITRIVSIDTNDPERSNVEFSFSAEVYK